MESDLGNTLFKNILKPMGGGGRNPQIRRRTIRHTNTHTPSGF